MSSHNLSYSMIVDTRKKHLKPCDTIILKNNKRYLPIQPRIIYCWIDDDSVVSCYQCNQVFSFFIRKHHCRSCGRIFCFECSNFKYNLPNFEIEQRVCTYCFNSLKAKKEIKNLLNVMILSGLDIKDFYIIGQVCKKWRHVFLEYMSTFRELQYALPYHNFTKFEKLILFNNKKYLFGHSKYIISLIKSSNSNNNLLDLLTLNNRKYKCWSLMCSRLCSNNILLNDIIILLHKLPTNIYIVQNLVRKLHFYQIKDILPYLLFLTLLLKDTKEIHWIIFHFVYSYAKKNLFFASLFYWYLITNIKIIPNDFLVFFWKELPSNYVNELKKTMRFISQIQQKKYNIKKPLVSPFESGVGIISIQKENIITKNSASRPKIIPIIVRKNKHNLVKQMLFKNEDVRPDILILDIITIMNNIIENEIRLKLPIVFYRIIPIHPKQGLISIVSNSHTIQEIKKMNFTIQNYIIEKNKNKKIGEIRELFMYSCVAYCVYSYILGIGDRHLDNIMVSQSGLLFHIDFSYMLGYVAKPLEPEIKITPDMIDAMGGEESSYYKKFQELCTIVYNCLRKHADIIIVLLSVLENFNSDKFNSDYIKTQLSHRLIPGESTEEAKLIFKTKIIKNSSFNYKEQLLDYCHNKTTTPGIISSLTNAYHSTSNYLNSFLDK